MNGTLLGAIEIIYDCIGEDFDHNRALESYSKATDDTGLFLAKVRPVLGGFEKYYYHNIPQDAVKAMVTKYDSAETNSLFKNVALLPDKTPILRRVLIPDSIFFAGDQYKDTYEPWGIHSDGASIFKRDLITTTVCGFLRQPGQKEIDDKLLGIMSILNNHYCRAMTVQNGRDTLEQAIIQSSNTLDLIDFGIVLYGKQAEPIFANAAAQRIINDKDGITLSPQQLSFLNPGANKTFQDMVSALYQPNLPLSAKPGGAIRVPRISQRNAYSAMLVPMRGRKSIGSAAAAIFLFDPSARKTVPVELFVTSYELSRSEAELAQCLALGDSLEEAAERRGVSRNTAKSQLRSIFAKTDTNRQSELVSLLLRSIAGINLCID